VLGLTLLAACGGSSGGPGPTPVIEPPQIACPADVTVKNVSGSSQPVTFPDPIVTKGAAPIATNCNRASGSSFPLGTTPVNCIATDSQQRSTACSFNVTLTGFTLTVKRFGTFGDSLTEGEIGRPNYAPTLLDPPNAYPSKLQDALETGYPGQGLIVVNRGHSGDPVETTVETIKRYVPPDKPDVVLILSGFNNLTQTCAPGTSGTGLCRSGIDAVSVGVLDCIRKTREGSADVKYIFVSTLTPPGATGSNRIDANAIIQANNRIKQVASQQAVVLVDSHAAFAGHEAEYVNVDGLHLRPAGYQALADAFFVAIKATIPQNTLLTAPR